MFLYIAPKFTSSIHFTNSSDEFEIWQDSDSNKIWFEVGIYCEKSLIDQIQLMADLRPLLIIICLITGKSC